MDNTLKYLKKTVSVALCIFFAVMISSSEVLPETLKSEGNIKNTTTIQLNENLTKVIETSGIVQPDFKKVVENDKLELYVGTENYKGQFAIVNKTTKQIFYSNPIDADKDDITLKINELKSTVLIGYYDQSGSISYLNNISDSINQNSYKVKKVKNGVDYVYEFLDAKIELTLQIRLNDDGSIGVAIPVEQIKENGNIKIYDVIMMPYFCYAGKTDDGFIFVPDGCGAVINLNNGKQESEPYYQPVYGDDYSDFSDEQKIQKEKIYLPVYGIRRNIGGILAIVTEGEEQSSVRACVSGTTSTYNYVQNEFHLRKLGNYSFAEGWTGRKQFTVFQKTKPTLKSIANRYYLLTKEESAISNMAETYKNYLLNNDLINKSQTNADILINFLGSVVKKRSIIGFPVNQKISLTSYNDALSMLDTLKSENIENIEVRLINSDDNSIEGKIVNKYKPSSALGGSDGFKELVNYSKTNNIRLFPDIDPVRIYKKSYPFQEFLIGTRNINDSIVMGYSYKINVFDKDLSKKSFYLAKAELFSSIGNNITKSISEKGIKTISLSTITDRVYSDFSKNAYEEWKYVYEVKKMLENMKANQFSIMMDKPNANYLKYADVIVNMPTTSSNFDIEDSQYPFYQIVVSGLIPFYSNYYNLSANTDKTYFDILATNSGISYIFCKNATADILNGTNYDNLIGVSFDAWNDTLVKNNQVLREMKSQLKNEVLLDVKYFNNGIIESYYQNYLVVINSNENEITHKGNKIPKLGYLVIKQGD